MKADGDVAGIERYDRKRGGLILCLECKGEDEPEDLPIDIDDDGYEVHPVCSVCQRRLPMRAVYKD